jgi:nucleotide-binding universal stress UspA family protein
MIDDLARAGILVGYDGSQHSTRALDWAILEARRHDAPLIVCTAVPDGTADPLARGAHPIPRPDLGAAAQRLLAQARARSHETAPDLPVNCTTVSAAPAAGLIWRADGAAMVVVGSRGRSGVASMLLGSVSMYVSAHAPCPVIVVPALDESSPARLRGLVVVGYDGSPQADAALAFAVTEASLRGAELEVVHSSEHADVAAEIYRAKREASRRRQQREYELLQQAIATWAEKHPDLQITPILTSEPTAPFLVDKSAVADLVVVGSHGHDPFTGMLLGSVSHAVLNAARCPVAVVRNPT